MICSSASSFGPIGCFHYPKLSPLKSLVYIWVPLKFTIHPVRPITMDFCKVTFKYEMIEY